MNNTKDVITLLHKTKLLEMKRTLRRLKEIKKELVNTDQSKN